MERTITLATIGRGHWGTVYWNSIQSLATEQTAGVPRIILPEANVFGRDYRAGLEDGRLTRCDGVIVACTTAAHFDVVRDLLAAGARCLLIEKPLTATTGEAEELCVLLDRTTDATVMVGHTLLYDPAYRTMQERAPSTIGRVTEIRYTSLRAPRIEGDTIIPDAGSPPISLFLDAAGSLPTTVTAQPLERDHVELTIEFANGVRGIARIGTDAPERVRAIMFLGERGRLTLNEFVDPRTLVVTNANGEGAHLTFPTGRTALQEELLHFVDCITGRASPRTPISAGADVVRVVAQAMESFQRGGVPTPCTIPAHV